MLFPLKQVSTPPENKRVSDKKPRCYIFFFGSENYAWVACDNVWPYLENREKYMTLSRPSASFQEAVDAIDNEVRESGGTIPEKEEEELKPQSPASMKKDEEAAQSASAMKRGRKRQSQAKGKTKDDLEEAEEEVKPTKSSKAEGDVEVKNRRLSRRKVKTDEEEEEEEEEAMQTTEDAEAKVEEMEIERVDKKQDDDDADKDVAKKEESIAENEKDKEERGLDTEAAADEPKSEDKDSANEKPVAVVVAKATRKSQVPAKQTADNQKSSSKKAYLPDILPPATTDIAKLKSGIVPTTKKIGFLGVGDLGEALVGCLLATGHHVTVWNRTISKCKDLLKKGATKCLTPSDVVNQCDITFACVSDAVALKDVVFGGKGVLQAISEGKGFVNLSTVDTETTMDVAEAITTRGGRFLEAPLIGSREMSKTGQMLVLTSGEQTLYEDCSSCLKAIGKNVFNLVDLGMASKMQIVLNALYGTTLAGLAESLSLASKVGLDPSEVLEVLGHSSASSSLIREKGNDMVRNKIIDASCRLTTLQRDLRLAINMSEIVDQPLHVGSAVNELFKKAKAKGYGDMDISAIYRAADL